MAHFANDPVLIRAFQEGHDISPLPPPLRFWARRLMMCDERRTPPSQSGFTLWATYFSHE
ncbi:MAG: hypothetical protein U1E91_03175 [Moraxella sp.]